MNCLNCGVEIEGKREGAKFCSPRCRVTFSRKQSVVTDNVTFKAPDVTDKFEYTVAVGPRDVQREVLVDKSRVRTGLYWYDIPIAAVPVLKKGWPGMPDYMNGRQYFLWWKNEFKEGKSGPVLHNPFPVYEDIKSIPIRTGMGV